MLEDPKESGSFHSRASFSQHYPLHQDINQESSLPDNYPFFMTNTATDANRPQYHERPFQNDYSNKSETYMKQSGHNYQKLHEQSGHRPHSSDYYEDKTAPNDDSEAFSRSVGDTVDIIKKRLLNRQEQNQSLSTNLGYDTTDNYLSDIDRHSYREDYQERNKEDMLMKKKSFKGKPNNIINCNKLKNNIVHQLFKMDKDTIHKLMDNPTSSRKFEYAINSLITESQNSLNRHMRSTAEKSLYGSTNRDFEYNETDAIYENTFMKQMQCLLDPQDTIILSDLKPIVMAELNKVLQLDEFDQNDRIHDDDYVYQNTKETDNDGVNNNSFQDEFSSADVNNSLEFSSDSCTSTHDERKNHEYFMERVKHFENNVMKKMNDENMVRITSKSPEHYSDSNELQPSNIQTDYNIERRISSEKRRNSLNNKDENMLDIKDGHKHALNIPLFDNNADVFSDDEDPFAELDKQYHVDVDPNLIKIDDPLTPENRLTPPINDVSTDYRSVENNTVTECDIYKTEVKSEIHPTSYECSSTININDRNSPRDVHDTRNVDLSPDKKPDITNLKQSVNSSSKSSETDNKSKKTINIHKRPMDEQPSHRKEKRKKSDSSSKPENSKQILNKNIIINVNDCASKTKEKCDMNSKSVVNLYFSKGENTNDVKKESNRLDLVDISYSDKYVKRKESSKQIKQKEQASSKRRFNSSTSSIHSSQSSSESLTPVKSEHKNKLKTFDMFQEKPRKIQVHQACRNTSIYQEASKPSIKLENKVAAKPSTALKSNRILKRSVSTQMSKMMINKQVQTIENKSQRKKNCTKATQTDKNIEVKHSGTKSTDVFERMKEIDMEIQQLLQEKFKLYNSLETKGTCSTTMPMLGMTVFNVDSYEEPKLDNQNNLLAEDSIITDITNLSEEELEKLALENVETTALESTESATSKRHSPKPLSDTPITKKKTSSRSLKKSKKKSSTKKAKTPDISILEEIILDDRPIEDIVSLKDLETSPIKTRSKKRRLQFNKNVQTKNCEKKTELAMLPSIKPCSVVLIRTDLYKLLHEMKEENKEIKVTNNLDETNKVIECELAQVEQPTLIMEEKLVVSEKNSVGQMQEAIINEIHFHDDMMDISEDIVIEDGKTLDVQNASVSRDLLLNEDCVVDNSCNQSCEDIANAERKESDGCRMYDFSADEELRKDTIAVSGNGDAVLAIEVRIFI